MADIFVELVSLYDEREYQVENDLSNEYEGLTSWWWEVYKEFKAKFGKRGGVSVLNDSAKKVVDAANRYCSKKFGQFEKALKGLEDESYEAAKQSEIERKRDAGEDVPDEDKVEVDYEWLGEYYQEYLADIENGEYDAEFKRIAESLKKAPSRSQVSWEWRDENELNYRIRRWSEELDLIEGFMSDYVANCQKELNLNKHYIMKVVFDEEEFSERDWQEIETQFRERRR